MLLLFPLSFFRQMEKWKLANSLILHKYVKKTVLLFKIWWALVAIRTKEKKSTHMYSSQIRLSTKYIIPPPSRDYSIVSKVWGKKSKILAFSKKAKISIDEIDIQRMNTTQEVIILTKFHKDRSKIKFLPIKKLGLFTIFLLILKSKFWNIEIQKFEFFYKI